MVETRAPGRQVPGEYQIGYGARLREALGRPLDKQLTDEFCKLLDGASSNTIKFAFQGKRSFGALFNSRIAARLGCDPDWLATGRGEMHSDRVWPFASVTLQEWLSLPNQVRAQTEVGLRAAVDASDSKLKPARAPRPKLEL